jgi:hypothetical protein
MRYRDAWLLIVLMLLAAGPLYGQPEKAPPGPTPEQIRAGELKGTLAKYLYVAKRAIPASENIFIEDGKVIEALFVMARQENGVALPAGQSAPLSKVVLLDKAVHVFFGEDKFAVLILTRDNRSVADMTTAELLDLAKKGLAALFTVKDPAKPPT